VTENVKAILTKFNIIECVMLRIIHKLVTELCNYYFVVLPSPTSVSFNVWLICSKQRA
jgi:hypothetical protein